MSSTTEYVEVEQARDLPGLRLVLTAGVPGPWGEAAKGLFDVKGIEYVRVRQVGGEPNEALAAWTGSDNAPIAVLDDERPRSSWFDLVHLAERLSPKPALIPDDAADRAAMFGLIHEIAGECGFGWQRRLMMLHPLLGSLEGPPPPQLEAVARLGGKYGYSPEVAQAAPARAQQVLDLLSDTLQRQREAGRTWLVGESPSAVDIYWATFAAMLDPLPEDVCPMGGMRRQYTLTPDAGITVDPALLEHRDLVYRDHLTLPMRF